MLATSGALGCWLGVAARGERRLRAARRDADRGRGEGRGGEDCAGPWASLLSRPCRPGPGSLRPFSPVRARRRLGPREAGESLPGPAASLLGVGPRRGAPHSCPLPHFLLLRLPGVGRGLDE